MPDTPRASTPLPYQPIAIHSIQHAWQVWGILAPGTTPLSDFLRPECWAHVQSVLTPRDTIHVKSEGGLFNAELEVERKFNGGAVVRVIREWHAPKVDESAVEKSGLRLEWGGPTHKFRFVDRATSEVARHGFNTKQDALDKLPEIVAERRA